MSSLKNCHPGASIRNYYDYLVVSVAVILAAAVFFNLGRPPIMVNSGGRHLSCIGKEGGGISAGMERREGERVNENHKNKRILYQG